MGARRGTVRWLVTHGLLAASCVVSGAESGFAQTFLGDANAGRRIFVERGCGRCHSIWGNGGVLGPDLALVGAGRSMDQLAGLFWNHTPRMIETVRLRGFPWPRFTESELADIISYVYYVKLFDELGDPRLGEQWFIAKRCAECHAVGGRGGRSGPALDSWARYVTPVMLAQGMWNAGPGMRDRQQAAGVPIPEFIGREMADIQAYIRRQSSSRSRKTVLLEVPDPGTGGRLFTSKGCIRCHGSDGGGTAYGPNVRGVTIRRRVSEIAGVLWNHSLQMSGAMQARGIPLPRFQGTELADVIAFLYYLPFSGTGGNERRGQQVFRDKGCASCHSPDAPARIGPDLSQSEAVGTTLGLATAMWNHAPAMFDMTQQQRVEWPRFDEDEMPDLLAYLRTLKDRR
jgi:cytochrome c2